MKNIKVKVNCKLPYLKKYFKDDKVYDAILIESTFAVSTKMILVTGEDGNDLHLNSNSSVNQFTIVEETIPEKWCVKGPINDIGFGNIDSPYNGSTDAYYFIVGKYLRRFYTIPVGYTEITKEQYRSLIESQKPTKPVTTSNLFTEEQKKEIKKMIQEELNLLQ